MKVFPGTGKQNPATPIYCLLVGGIAVYLLLYTFNSLTRTRQFSPDSMNYVDVARNIALGKGLVQSTLGFNQPFLFEKDAPIPTPFVSQPPVYPILVAILGRFIPTYADAALLIPAVAYGITLLLAYLLGRGLYGEQIALIFLACLLLYLPLSYVSRYAWTESVGIVFLFLTFLLLSNSLSSAGTKSLVINSFFAGLATGLAFGTRYAMLPVFFLGLLFLIIEHAEWNLRLTALLSFCLGASLPVTLILAHNWLSTGRILPPLLPSNRPLLIIFQDAIYSTLGNYILQSGEQIQVGFALMVILYFSAVLFVQRRARVLFLVFVGDRHYLPSLWFLFYTGFILYQRSIGHYDIIDTRIMVPGAVILVFLVVALIVKTLEPRITTRLALAILFSAVLFACVREIVFAQSHPAIKQDQEIARSDRLSWIAQHTTQNDLVIGDLTMDVPFYFPGHLAISFFAYPYTIHLTYPALMDVANNNCSRFQHIFLILRSNEDVTDDIYLYQYGQFITDLRFGNTARYPWILATASLRDETVFQVSCNSSN